MKKHLNEMSNFIFIGTAYAMMVQLSTYFWFSTIMFFVIACGLYLASRFVKE